MTAREQVRSSRIRSLEREKKRLQAKLDAALKRLAQFKRPPIDDGTVWIEARIWILGDVLNYRLGITETFLNKARIPIADVLEFEWRRICESLTHTAEVRWLAANRAPAGHEEGTK
jgi:hypothetical protein